MKRWLWRAKTRSGVPYELILALQKRNFRNLPLERDPFFEVSSRKLSSWPWMSIAVLTLRLSQRSSGTWLLVFSPKASICILAVWLADNCCKLAASIVPKACIVPFPARTLSAKNPAPELEIIDCDVYSPAEIFRRSQRFWAAEMTRTCASRTSRACSRPFRCISSDSSLSPSSVITFVMPSSAIVGAARPVVDKPVSCWWLRRCRWMISWRAVLQMAMQLTVSARSSASRIHLSLSSPDLWPVARDGFCSISVTSSKRLSRRGSVAAIILWCLWTCSSFASFFFLGHVSVLKMIEVETITYIAMALIWIRIVVLKSSIWPLNSDMSLTLNR